MASDYDALVARGGLIALEMAGRFFMKDNPVIYALQKVTKRLQDLNIPYAVAGGLAVAAHGYLRTTVDVDLLVTPEGLKAAHEKLDGLGYVPPFIGSKQLKDTEHGVRVEFLVAGQYPGDGKPKPVAFPDPDQVAVEIDGIRYLSLAALVELKLASGISNAGRFKDLGDVQELIRLLNLRDDFAQRLNPYVRDRFLELLRGVESDPSQS
jgi:hypothetical protein